MGRNKPVRRKTTLDKTPGRLVAHGLENQAFTYPRPSISQAPVLLSEEQVRLKSRHGSHQVLEHKHGAFSPCQGIGGS